jgi:molecular chaperone DnaK (HSP70)
VDGRPTVPSVVSYDAPPDGGTVVGAAAAALRASRPRHTVHDAKRLIGRAADDALVLAEAVHLPYAVVPDARGAAAVAVPGVELPVAPEAVAAVLLRHLKAAAERARPLPAALGFRFGSATISVPVAFAPAQRAATLRAGKAAGFRLVRLLDEPVAAAIAYGLADASRERTVLVYDMGGGTLDVAVLRLELSSRTFMVLATAGDAHLGGEDFDRALAVRCRVRDEPLRAVLRLACLVRVV